MLFAAFGLGVMEIAVLGVCCVGLIGIVFVILTVSVWSKKPSEQIEIRRQAAEQIAREMGAADAGEERKTDEHKTDQGKSDKDPRFEKDNPATGGPASGGGNY